MQDKDKKEPHRQQPLKEVFGEYVELNAGEGAAGTYRIMAELDISGVRYAVLQSDAMRKEGDIEIFRVVAGGAGDLELESVESDEEWECAAEAYDDLQFGSEERP